jgi:hypothetical protein
MVRQIPNLYRNQNFMTVLVATSVVRGSHQGESHGGVYLINIDEQEVVQAIDWNNTNIDWQGRGWDRGLRGIAFDGDRVFIAASDELFEYTPEFKLISSYRNKYLKHCHEICRYGRRLFLTSTGFDSILGFDLDNNKFSFGLSLSDLGDEFRGTPFKPDADEGPRPGNNLHINNVVCNENAMFISGRRTRGLLEYTGQFIKKLIELPEGIHNARPYREGILFNDTDADVVRHVTRSGQIAFEIPKYDIEKLTHAELGDDKVARQGFGRGLCEIGEDVVASGSSPSTIFLHNLDTRKTFKQITLSFDIRNAIHGLEVWPYDSFVVK